MSNDHEQTHYDVLGLSHHAHVSQVNKQYRVLRAEFRYMGVEFDDPRYEALNRAHRTLHNQELREQYNQKLKEQGLYHSEERISGQTPLSDLFEGVESTTSSIQQDEAEIIYEQTTPSDQPQHVESATSTTSENQQTHYDVLGIQETATSHEIIDAYRILGNHFEQLNDQEHLERIRKAYTILSNTQTRNRYNEELIQQGRLTPSKGVSIFLIFLMLACFGASQILIYGVNFVLSLGSS